MQVGDKVRTREGYETTVLAGYEGTVLRIHSPVRDGTVLVKVDVTKLPDRHELKPKQTATMFTLAHKLEVIE